MTFEELKQRYEEFLDFREDPDILRLIYGALCANQLQGNPVWLMIIGPAGCGKSELLMSLSAAKKHTYTISSLTPYSLMSGYGDSDETSLIHKLRDKVLIIKDLSSTTEIGKEDRGLLFSFLRDAYDGQVSRATGRGVIRFEGKFGIIAAGTLAVEQGRKMEAVLGERFLYLRPRFKGEKILEISLRNATRKIEMRRTLQNAAGQFLSGYSPPAKRTLPKGVIEASKEAARVLVRTRSTVIRDSYRKEIEFPAEVMEIPTRVYEQFILLALAMRSLGADADEMEQGIKRLLLDSIPYVRMRVLEAIADGNTTKSAVAKAIKMSSSPASRCMEDMENLGIIEKNQYNDLTVVSTVLQSALKNGVRKP
jgi:energy-coupling factor transporter ATP-binding protein EcfA2